MPILNTLPVRAKALRHGASIEQNLHTVFHFKTAKSAIKQERVKAFALTGRGDSTMRKTQGVASLALGYVLHWAFSPPLLNPKLELQQYTNAK